MNFKEQDNNRTFSDEQKFAHLRNAISERIDAEFWQHAMQERADTLLYRIVYALIIAVSCIIMDMNVIVMVSWLALATLTQILDANACEASCNDPSNLNLRKSALFFLALACTFYVSIATIVFSLGGFEEKVLMLIFAAGGLTANCLKSQKVAAIGRAMTLPYIITFALIFIIDALVIHSFEAKHLIMMMIVTLCGKAFVVKALSISQDNIKAIKTAAIEAEILEYKAVQANEAKSTFLANMSHEMRTPLNAILGAASLLDRKIKNKEEKELLNTLGDAGKNLLQLLNDLLDLSKIEAGRMDIEAIAFSPQDLVISIKKLWQPSAQKKEIELQIIQDVQINDALFGDPNRIRQIINNLVSNAIKFTESGSVSIILANEGDNLSISVKDSGMGIKPEAIEIIFEAYVQADASISRGYGGTGLGLATSRKLARLMGGDLVAQSEFGKGSIFKLTIPRKIAKYEQIVVLNNNQKHIYEDHSGLNALIADDNPANRLILQKYLEIGGMNSTFAHDGFEALELIKNQSFDILFLDLRMPNLDGLSVCREARKCEKNKNVPIIIVSADAGSGHLQNAIAAGANQYLTKPLQIEVLFDAIDEVLSQNESCKAQENLAITS